MKISSFRREEHYQKILHFLKRGKATKSQGDIDF